MAEGPPRREHAAGGRVAQVDEVGQPGGLCRHSAREISTIRTNAGVPSCIRVPPDGRASSGSRSAVARRTAAVIRSAAARPIDPARKPNSHTNADWRRGPGRAGEDRLVGAGLRRGRRELGRSRVAPPWSIGWSHGAKVPSSSTRSSAPARSGRLTRVRRRRREVVACWSRSGGGGWPPGHLAPSASKNRSGGPGSVSGPSWRARRR